jgi:hypothetical protein
MARPSTRSELAEYCLRALGHPVIEINIDDDQLEDRIDEAIQYWQDYNRDGVVRTFVKHAVTAEQLESGVIPIPDSVLTISQVLSFQDLSSVGLFNAKYQMHLNDFFGLRNPGGLVNYEMTQQYMGLVEDVITGHGVQMSYSRVKGNVTFFQKLSESLSEGSFIIFDCYVLVNPSDYPKIYNDPSLKELCTLLIKKQWGINISKFEGMQLPGGVTINGRQIYEDAVNDIKEFKEGYQSKYENPVDFYIG